MPRYGKFSGTFHPCVMPRYVSSLELSTHASCYAMVSSVELSTHASCHAIVSSLELSTHTLFWFKSYVGQVSVEHRLTWSYTYIHVDICVHICSCICITYTLHLCITYHIFKIQDLVIYVRKILFTQNQILRAFAHMWKTMMGAYVTHIAHICCK